MCAHPCSICLPAIRARRRGSAPIDAASTAILPQFRNYQSGTAMAVCANASPNATRGAKSTTCRISGVPRVICRLITTSRRPTRRGRGRCRWRYRACPDALEPHSIMLKKAAEAVAGDIQRASGERRRDSQYALDGFILFSGPLSVVRYVIDPDDNKFGQSSERRHERSDRVSSLSSPCYAGRPSRSVPPG